MIITSFDFERLCLFSTSIAVVLHLNNNNNNNNMYEQNERKVEDTVQHHAVLTPKPCSVCQSETLPQQKWLPPKLNKGYLQQISGLKSPNICH